MEFGGLNMASKISYAMHEALAAIERGEMTINQAAAHYELWPASIYRQLNKDRPTCPTCGQMVRRKPDGATSEPV